jgi:Uma2 family endonuclease
MRAAPIHDIPDDAPSMTLDEWFALDEDEPGELVDGRLVEAEVPDWLHETIVRWFVVELALWARSHDARVAPSGVKYAVSQRRGRMPDASVFLGDRRPPARGLVREPPDIAIEVVSSTPKDARRDRIEKLAEYSAFGIRWYWLVDPGLRTLEVWELREGTYARAGVASTALVSEIPGCPDLVLDLDALWAEVDSLG